MGEKDPRHDMLSASISGNTMPTSPSSIVIIDCGIGNHQSVWNALKLIGHSAEISSDPKVIAGASHLIFPGVGSFAAGMQGMHERNLGPLLTKAVLQKKKPILGICLGMQLFATEGHEHSKHVGLGWISGTVELIDTKTSGLPLPHIGWNDVSITQDHAITKGFTGKPIFYFVHSYHLIPTDPKVIMGVADYGTPVTAIIAKANIVGVQFHPEKSHEDGLQIFRNFLAM